MCEGETMKVRLEKIASIIFSSIKIKILKVFPNLIIYKFITVGTVLSLLFLSKKNIF
jgi:hypothetical protein